MNRTTGDTIARAILMAAAIPAMLSRGASADIIAASFINDDNYSYVTKFMPDFDQRREAMPPGLDGLPGNGSMYCVPASSTNLLAYMANHGFPEVTPGPGYWQSNARYDDATQAIYLLGVMMNTTATGGTGGGGPPGLAAWLQAYQKFTVTAYWMTDSFTPTQERIAETAVGGSLVSFGYGRYDVIGNLFGAPILGDRTGGHAITLSHAVGFGDLRILGVRDPADDPDSSDPNYLFTQSIFGNRYFDAENRGVLTCENIACSRIMTGLNYVPGGDRIALIDSYVGVKPVQGYSFGNCGAPCLTLIDPYPLIGSSLLPSEFSLSPGGALRDVVIHPDLNEYFVLRDGPIGTAAAELHRVNPMTADEDVWLTIPDATAMYFGRHRNLYVIARERLHCLSLELADPIVTTTVMPGIGDALTCDDATDQVVVLSVQERAMMLYPRSNIMAEPTVMPIPNWVPLGGSAILACSPADPGRVWLISDASDAVYGVSCDDGMVQVEQVELASIAEPHGLDFDDRGHMFVGTGDLVVELRPGAGAEAWVQVSDEEADFSRGPVGPRFRITRSRTNYDPGLHDGPGWVNIDPEELDPGTFVPDCNADVNGDGVVDFADLTALLAAWGPCEICAADTDADRLIGFSDLTALLAAWGPCP